MSEKKIKESFQAQIKKIKKENETLLSDLIATKINLINAQRKSLYFEEQCLKEKYADRFKNQESTEKPVEEDNEMNG